MIPIAGGIPAVFPVGEGVGSVFVWLLALDFGGDLVGCLGASARSLYISFKDIFSSPFENVTLAQ